MNNTGFFFCGLLVGVVVSAAFGLDFFPTTAPEKRSETSMVDSGRSPSPEGPTRLDTDVAALRQKVVDMEQKLTATEAALKSKEAELATLEARLKTSPPDESKEVVDLELAQGELVEERQRARRLKADLELSYQETYNLLKQFFASKRRPEDAILISEYFATTAPEKLKGDLVDQLLKTNREVIASLSPASSLLAGSGAVGGLTPVSAKRGASRPEAAVHRGDQLDTTNPDRQQKIDGSGSSRPHGDEKKAVELPPPPGE